MSLPCFRAAAVLHLGIGLAGSASAQSRVEPERVADARRIFDAARAQQLRCEITPERPALSFGFRFQTGYTIGIPLSQFRGPGHQLTVYTRVSSEGQAPVFLTSTERLPEVADTKVDAETRGTFVVGEGAYEVAVVVEDEGHRTCRSSWQIQARRVGSERQLAPATPPGAILDCDSPDLPVPENKTGLKIGRLTILVHAAPLSPRLSRLQPNDVQRIADSLASLLRQLPTRSVRLIAFNLDQRAIVWRKDGFAAEQIGELTDTLHQLELARVDYRVLQNTEKPIDLLTGLVQAELRDQEPPDGLIVLGPQIQTRDDVPPQALDKAKSSALFYLQYQSALPFGSRLMQSRGGAYGADRPRAYPGDTDAPSMPMPPGAGTDGVERLVTRLKGDTLRIRAPHDLADAIRRMDLRIVKTAAPADAPARTKPSPGNIAPPAEPEPAPRETPPEPVSANDQDPAEVLIRLREQVLEHGSRIPNHTCVETVERERYDRNGDPAPRSCDAILARRQTPNSSSALRLAATDRLRLDVAFSGDREIYSWAGANRFDEGEIDELIPEGAMGTGPYTTFLLSIFLDRTPRFIFEGEAPLAGRSLFEYSFRVPREDSHYRHKAGKQWLVIGYSGTLLVDPRTSELVRLTVRTEELPPETQSCEVDTTMDYGKVRLNAGDFLLPKSTHQRFIGRDGSEAENSYAFSQCRDFQAASTIAFGDGQSTVSKPPVASATLPQWAPGLPVTIDVTSPIDSGSAAAGDRIEGRLALPLSDQNHLTLAPQGTKAQGRLMRVMVRHGSPPQVTLVLRWETLELDGLQVPLSLRPNRGAKPGLQTGGLAGLAGLKRRGMEIELPLPGEERYAFFHFPGKRHVVDAGLRTEWFTAKP